MMDYLYKYMQCTWNTLVYDLPSVAKQRYNDKAIKHLSQFFFFFERTIYQFYIPRNKSLLFYFFEGTWMKILWKWEKQTRERKQKRPSSTVTNNWDKPSDLRNKARSRSFLWQNKFVWVNVYSKRERRRKRRKSDAKPTC